MKCKNYLFLLLIGLLCNFSIADAQTISVEAETYSAVTAGTTPVVKENSGTSIGYFDEKGEMLTYSINITSPGYYQVSFKYNAGNNGTVTVKTASQAQGLVSFNGQTYTGGWWLMPIANWPTTEISKCPLFYFAAGVQNLYLISNGAGFNIDYITITKSTNQNVTISKIEVTPSSVKVKPTRKTTLTAKAVTSTGVEVAAPITWSSNAPNGLYTAGSTLGATDEIIVTSGSITTKVPVTVKMPEKRRDFMVTKHGPLKTSGKGLANKDNQMTSFAGPSFAWSCSTPQYWTAGAVRYFVEDWKAGIIRLPMSIAPGYYKDEDGSFVGTTWNDNNYMKNPEYAIAQMERMIDAAIENDIYVIVDFHEHHANKSDIKALAVSFFTEIASMYKDCPNILYEIYNEPLKFVSNSEVTAYANEIIPVIRQYSANSVIIVGSTWWSQQPGNVNGVNGSNIAYTLHYYANQHGTSLLGQLDCGRPVVVTECGVDADWADAQYVQKCKDNGISHMTWEVSNKQADGDPAWSIFPSNDNPDPSTWTDASLTGPGKKQKGIVTGWPRAVQNPGQWIDDCDDFVLSSIEIVAPKTKVALNESMTLTVKGKSSCQDLPVSNVVWSANAPGGVFKNAVEGVYKVTATSGSLKSEVIITVTNDAAVETKFKIEAESFTSFSTQIKDQYDKDLQKENNGLSIGYFNQDGETITYSVNVPASGEYDVVLKYSSEGAGTIGLKFGTSAEQSVSFAASQNPGNWWELGFSSWPISAISKVTLAAGSQTLVITNKGKSINLDYLEFTTQTTVVDAVAPVITLKGQSPETVELCTTYTDEGATATDAANGNLTDIIVTTSNVNTNVEGQYTVTYDVTDLSGNKAIRVARTVVVSISNSLEVARKSNIIIYPNPSNGLFNIKANNSYYVEVYDLAGTKVLAQEIEEDVTQIDLGDRKGMFLVKISNETENYIERVIIK